MENLKKELVRDENIVEFNGQYRYVSCVVKLATLGFTNKEKLADYAATMDFDGFTIQRMRNTYYHYFTYGGVPILINQPNNNSSEEDEAARKIIDVVLGIYNDHKNKLNILKGNRSRAEEEKWSDKEIEAVDRQIEILASVLSDLFRKVIDTK